jgi:hypothetical protein
MDCTPADEKVVVTAPVVENVAGDGEVNKKLPVMVKLMAELVEPVPALFMVKFVKEQAVGVPVMVCTPVPPNVVVLAVWVSEPFITTFPFKLRLFAVDDVVEGSTVKVWFTVRVKLCVLTPPPVNVKVL